MDREGTPRRLRAVPNDATQVQFATLHGYKRAYRRAGSGPAVLLLHGIGDNSLAWEPLFAQLSEEYTVIAPDFLGHGFSDRPRADYSVSAFANGMRDLLTYLDIERVTVVGHSLGGGVAGQFAYQYPELVERLVLVGTGGVTKDVNPALRALSLPFSEYILGLMSIPAVFATFSTAAKSLQNLIPTTLFTDNNEIVRVLERMPEKGSAEVFARTLRSAVDWRGQVVTMLDRCYLSAAIPTLIVWGSDDQVIPVAHAHMLHSAMPGSQLEVFDGAGHFPFRDDPERFLDLFFTFVGATNPAVISRNDVKAALRQGPSVKPLTGDSGTRHAVLDALGNDERSAT
ncbi:pimeloyl-ACP methyl ester carboxylesterase [Williamsia limnetica]|uniref:Pimeloyl-ACP methyl ester carboxylesterase n=1 Tax=Williamsia limnetica TaxID=882452 RepID=A0A318RRQ3_WILLI|nr:alpha/beta hydrolase [Williamsia limnetica]PYE20916.1 pimeloyl-ACP methyl ester carboxylesterase [Williamsia limnetica]